MLMPLVCMIGLWRLQLEHDAEFHDLISLLKAHVNAAFWIAWVRTCATYTFNRVGCQPGI